MTAIKSATAVNAVLLPARPPSAAVTGMRTDTLSHRVGAAGLCSDSNDDRMYPNGMRREQQAEHARALCLGCSVRDECLELVLRIESQVPGGPHGVWGGTAPHERREMVAARREARHG